MSSHPRILVTPRSLTEHGLDRVSALDPLRSHGFELISAPPGQVPTEQELLRLVPGCVGWLAGVEQINERVLSAAGQLRVISRNGTGTDGIDLTATNRAGVRVERAAGANAQGVAELALTLALCTLRQIPRASATLKDGGWRRIIGVELAEITVGVIGMGAIGRRTAALFTALGAGVVGYDPYPADTSTPLVDLPTLLASSDVVSLHCPPQADGRPLIDADRLTHIRRGAVLVNTARSALVDDGAVLAALQNDRLSAYAVDAFDAEPPEITPLLRHERVLATPHIGGYTRASVARATTEAVHNMLTALAGVHSP
jgi:D-3-phosphoglycerate dehydrogenase